MSAAAIRAEISGGDTAVALGIRARAYAPILALCRKLVEAGHDPRRRLHACRGGVLALRVRSIGEAADLEINGHGTGFKQARDGGTAPPSGYSGSPTVPTRADAAAIGLAAALAAIPRNCKSDLPIERTPSRSTRLYQDGKTKHESK
jgi:hypothetical protein